MIYNYLVLDAKVCGARQQSDKVNLLYKPSCFVNPINCNILIIFFHLEWGTEMLFAFNIYFSNVK
jgi:hypothetical protein